ncbi:hypothetical protein TNCT_12601, partial [Trichonephila clavata]
WQRWLKRRSFGRKSDLSFETRQESVACRQLLRQGHAPRRGIYCTLVEQKNGLPAPTSASSFPFRVLFRVLLILESKLSPLVPDGGCTWLEQQCPILFGQKLEDNECGVMMQDTFVAQIFFI